MRHLLLLLTLSFSAALHAAPKAEAWERWRAHEAGSKLTLDHGAWDEFLRTQLRTGSDGIARIAYGRVTPTQRKALAGYLAALQAQPVSRLNRAEQYAYWVNLYNAATVNVVLDHYPVESILKINISPGLFARGPWGRKLLKVEAEALSLDDIEHRILRPLWQDARTHYAVNCASLGCPNLPPRAFTAANTETLLEAGARAYVNHPRGARVEGGRLRVSSIYDWFKADFGGTDAGVIAHLRRYANPPLAQALANVGRVQGYDYDWSLNELP